MREFPKQSDLLLDAMREAKEVQGIFWLALVPWVALGVIWVAS